MATSLGVIMKTNNGRVYKSIYFKDGLSGNRKRRDVTVAFSREGELFEKCKDLKSADVKQIIGIESYEVLCSCARAGSMKLSSYIKKVLEEKLLS